MGRDDSEADETPARRPPRPAACVLCARSSKPLTFHHLIPRHCHKKPRFLRRFAVAEMRTRGIWICRDCHGGIHDLIEDEKDLGWNYHTVELLMAHDGIRRHVDWVRKKK